MTQQGYQINDIHIYKLLHLHKARGYIDDYNHTYFCGNYNYVIFCIGFVYVVFVYAGCKFGEYKILFKTNSNLKTIQIYSLLVYVDLTQILFF